MRQQAIVDRLSAAADRDLYASTTIVNVKSCLWILWRRRKGAFGQSQLL